VPYTSSIILQVRGEVLSSSQHMACSLSHSLRRCVPHLDLDTALVLGISSSGLFWLLPAGLRLASSCFSSLPPCVS